MAPKIVVICGSTRHPAAIAAAGREEALTGRIVLGPWSFERQLTAETSKLLTDAHRHMIRMADEVLVVAPGGHIGESTQSEITYAEQLGKPIRVLHLDGAS